MGYVITIYLGVFQAKQLIWEINHCTEHCLDALRQTLMCHSDVTPTVFHVGMNGDGIFPKLAATHTCRNFDKVKQWALDHRAGEFRWQLQEGDKLLDYFRTNPEWFHNNGGT